MAEFSFDNYVLNNVLTYSADHVISAVVAIFLVAIFGGVAGTLKGNANPIIWTVVDSLWGSVARRAYNVERSPGSLAFRGSIITVAYVVTAFALGFLFLEFDQYFFSSDLIEAVFLSLVLTGGAVWSAMNKLYLALCEGKTLNKGSFYEIAVTTRSNLNSTDDFGITRVGVGYMPIIFDKGLVAPIFWYLIGGLPLAYLYAGIAAARWGLAKEGFAKGQGDTALWLDRLFGFIPHLIAAILMACAALFTPGAQFRRAVPGLFGSKGRAPYAQGGLVLSAVAWAIGVSLGGPVEDLDGSVLKKDWIGATNATARVDKGHLRRAIYMSVVAYLLLTLALFSTLLI